MKIGTRIGLMFGIILTGMTALSLLNMRQSDQLSQSLDIASNELLPNIEQAGRLNHQFQAIRINTLRHALSSGHDQMQQIEASLVAEKNQLLQALQQYQQKLAASNLQEQTLVETIQTDLAEYYRYSAEVLGLSRANHTEQVLQLIETKLSPSAQKTLDSLEQLIRLNQQQAQQQQQLASQQYQTGLWLQWSALLAMLIIAIIVGLWFNRSLTHPLRQLRDLVTSIETEHDFTRRLNIQQQDEIGDTLKAFNSLVSSVQTSLQEITVSSHSVSQAAGSLQSSASALAHSSQNQSDSAAQMAATMEQMTVSISHMADRGQDTQATASQAGQIAQQSAAVIEATVRDINQIDQVMQSTAQQIASLEKQSESISAVVNVIKEVADQTNLLALNAAIEAARAGEQGRGFAVVAEEVRKLAERTASSTQEITRMVQAVQQDAQNAVKGVENAVSQVNQGVTHAREAGSAIEQIRSSTAKVVDMVNEMAQAISEQSAASNSIASNVERIATMSEDNHLTSGSTAQAAASLNDTAERMAETLGRFKL